MPHGTRADLPKDLFEKFAAVTLSRTPSDILTVPVVRPDALITPREAVLQISDATLPGRLGVEVAEN